MASAGSGARPLCLAHVSATGSQGAGQRAPALKEQIDEVGERSTVRRLPIGPEPATAPQVEHLSSSAEWSLGRVQGRERLLFRTHDRRGIVRLLLQLHSRGDGCTQHGDEIVCLEQPGMAWAFAASRTAAWLTLDVARRRANKAVAGYQAVIEKCQRFVCGERRQPEREPRNLHGSGVDIDTEQAARGDVPAESDAVGRRHIRSMPSSFVDEGLLGGLGQLRTSGDQEGAAAHRGIGNPQSQDLVGGSTCDERCERLAHNDTT